MKVDIEGESKVSICEDRVVVEKRGVLAQPDTALFFTSPATPQG